MLSRAGRARAWLPGGSLPRPLSAGLAVLAAAAAVFLTAAPAAADHVRDQQQWVLDALQVPAAWQATEGRGVTVAVIDSGVDPHVSDLAGAVVTGPDLTGVRTPPSNPNWGIHGTWMAALIAGHGHGPAGQSGIIGVAPQARILSIRVVTDTGDPGYRAYQREPDEQVQQALATAIRYAASHHAGVISMSLGYQAPSLPVRAALQFALARGTVVVASAGNSGDRATAHDHGQAPYSFPADYPGVLGVGAVAQDGSTAAFSSANLSVQVAAPGVMVPTQGRDGKYWYVNGTSPACALTAGVAALIKARYPALPPYLVDDAITASTLSKPPGGYDDQVGFGTVDAAAALARAHRLASGLARHVARAGIAAAAHFGGGPAAVPPAPVRPRSGTRLVIYSGLAVLFLAGTAAAGWWVLGSRRQVAGPRPQERITVPAQPGEDSWRAMPGSAGAPGWPGAGSGGWVAPANGVAGGGWPGAGSGTGSGGWPAPGNGTAGGGWPGAGNGTGSGDWPGAGGWAAAPGQPDTDWPAGGQAAGSRPGGGGNGHADPAAARGDPWPAAGEEPAVSAWPGAAVGTGPGDASWPSAPEWPAPNAGSGADTWPGGRWPAGSWPAGSWPAGSWPAGSRPAESLFPDIWPPETPATDSRPPGSPATGSRPPGSPAAQNRPPVSGPPESRPPGRGASGGQD